MSINLNALFILVTFQQTLPTKYTFPRSHYFMFIISFLLFICFLKFLFLYEYCKYVILSVGSYGTLTLFRSQKEISCLQLNKQQLRWSSAQKFLASNLSYYIQAPTTTHVLVITVDSNCFTKCFRNNNSNSNCFSNCFS